jgi:hypothetical protein
LAGIEISNPMRTACWAINQEKKETYMSKNLTRKGLALGAVVALGSSLFAGTPANAAAELTIAPNAGTTYNVLATDDFVLKAYGNTVFSIGTTTDLRWKITKSATATITYADNVGAVTADPT